MHLIQARLYTLYEKCFAPLAKKAKTRPSSTCQTAASPSFSTGKPTQSLSIYLRTPESDAQYKQMGARGTSPSQRFGLSSKPVLHENSMNASHRTSLRTTASAENFSAAFQQRKNLHHKESENHTPGTGIVASKSRPRTSTNKENSENTRTPSLSIHYSNLDPKPTSAALRHKRDRSKNNSVGGMTNFRTPTNNSP